MEQVSTVHTSHSESTYKYSTGKKDSQNKTHYSRPNHIHNYTVYL